MSDFNIWAIDIQPQLLYNYEDAEGFIDSADEQAEQGNSLYDEANAEYEYIYQHGGTYDYKEYGLLFQASVPLYQQATTIYLQAASLFMQIVQMFQYMVCKSEPSISDFCSMLCQAVTVCPQCFMVNNWPQSRDYIEEHLTSIADNESTVNDLLNAFNVG